MLSHQQIIARTQGLGASDAPAVLGLSPWRSPLEVWLEKVGRLAPADETLPMRVGKALEPVVLHQFTDKTGLIVTEQQRQFYDTLNPWRWATVDGIASDGNLVEAKTTGDDREWGEEGSDQVPLHYVVQVQHALAVTGLALAWVPVLFNARDFRLYRVERDQQLIDEITARESAFWQRVLDNDPPDAITVSDLRLRYAKDTGASIIADVGACERVATLKTMQVSLKDAETQAEQVKAEVMAYMGEAANLVDAAGELLVTWRTSKPRKSFDSKALQNAWPDLYAKFTTEGAPVRQFRLK